MNRQTHTHFSTHVPQTKPNTGSFFISYSYSYSQGKPVNNISFVCCVFSYVTLRNIRSYFKNPLFIHSDSVPLPLFYILVSVEALICTTTPLHNSTSIVVCIHVYLIHLREPQLFYYYYYYYFVWYYFTPLLSVWPGSGSGLALPSLLHMQ